MTLSKNFKPDKWSDEKETKPMTRENHRLANAQAVVDEQAEDEGLWFHAQTAPEAFLQEALRRLSRAVEQEVTDPDEYAK